MLSWFLNLFKEKEVLFQLQPSLEEQLNKDLLRLGNTSTEVAKTLFFHSFRGKRRDVFHCPIASYLSFYTPLHIRSASSTYHICVSSATYVIVSASSFGTEKEEVLARGTLPLAVQEFIRLFDYHSAYPELVEQSDV